MGMSENTLSQLSLNHRDGQHAALSIPAVAHVALLIDGENVIVPDLLAYVLVEAGKMGGVTIRRVYGNWATPQMLAWKKVLDHYDLEPMGVNTPKSGHNATDIALVVDAMDMLYAGIKHYCLVAGDSDYVPLVQRLRRENCTVLGIGNAVASTTLKETCSRFLLTEQLMPQAAPPAIPPPLIPLPATTALSTLLIEAYRAALRRSTTGWVLLSAFGLALRQIHPDFEAMYGKQQLSSLLNLYPDLFEIRQRQIGKGEAAEARLREPFQPKL